LLPSPLILRIFDVNRLTALLPSPAGKLHRIWFNTDVANLYPLGWSRAKEYGYLFNYVYKTCDIFTLNQFVVVPVISSVISVYYIWESQSEVVTIAILDRMYGVVVFTVIFFAGSIVVNASKCMLPSCARSCVIDTWWDDTDFTQCRQPECQTWVIP